MYKVEFKYDGSKDFARDFSVLYIEKDLDKTFTNLPDFLAYCNLFRYISEDELLLEGEQFDIKNKSLSIEGDKHIYTISLRYRDEDKLTKNDYQKLINHYNNY